MKSLQKVLNKEIIKDKDHDMEVKNLSYTNTHHQPAHNITYRSTVDDGRAKLRSTHTLCFSSPPYINFIQPPRRLILVVQNYSIIAILEEKSIRPPNFNKDI